MAQTQRSRSIARLEQARLDRLVDAISLLFEQHPEPYRTLAECLILSRGEGAVDSMVQHIELAIREDCHDAQQ